MFKAAIGFRPLSRPSGKPEVKPAAKCRALALVNKYSTRTRLVQLLHWAVTLGGQIAGAYRIATAGSE